MKVPGNHLDFGQILPSLSELEGTIYSIHLIIPTTRNGERPRIFCFNLNSVDNPPKSQNHGFKTNKKQNSKEMSIVSADIWFSFPQSSG